MIKNSGLIPIYLALTLSIYFLCVNQKDCVNCYYCTGNTI